MDKQYAKQMERRLGYEKHIITQIHEEIFQTTSEHKYYELGVAQGMYSIYTMCNNLIVNGYDEVKLEQLMDVIKQSATEFKDHNEIGNMFNRMIDYDKEDEV